MRGIAALVAMTAAGVWAWQNADRLLAVIAPPPLGAFVETRVTDLFVPDHGGNPAYAAPENRFASATFVHDGRDRRWHWIAPSTPEPVPAIIMLHGSGRNGAAMLDMWQGIGAGKAMLIAPDALDAAGWGMAQDGPAFLDAVLAAANRVHPIDPDRVYLVGHSAGANHALHLANQGGPWRAVAVHAGAIDLRDIAPRPGGAPILMIVGDADAFFPVAAVRQSATALAAAGHAVDLRIIAGHDHWFYAIAPKLVPGIAAFLFTRPAAPL